MKLKVKMFRKIFAKTKMLKFTKTSKESKCYDKMNNLIGGKMKDETCGVLKKALLD